jgi:mannose-1-phosphate guanylyltransferase/mannose-6-phosphate isomerase
MEGVWCRRVMSVSEKHKKKKSVKASQRRKNNAGCLYAVIIAGGSGTRFWPLSREDTPKQLLSIGGGETLIQSTVSRISQIIPLEQTFIVTNPKQRESINLQLLASTGRPWDNCFIIEPEAKNTAPAIGLAAVYLKKLNPDGIMAVLPSDHVVKDSGRFCSILQSASEAASKGYLVTIGLKPDKPETGYGYIKCGEKIKDGVFIAAAFKEKPGMELARKYLKDGSYYWNSGIFVWRTDVILSAFKKYMPDLYAGLMKIEKAIGSAKEQETVSSVFSLLKPESID